jgi:hypothetical protein
MTVHTNDLTCPRGSICATAAHVRTLWAVMSINASRRNVLEKRRLCSAKLCGEALSAVPRQCRYSDGSYSLLATWTEGFLPYQELVYLLRDYTEFEQGIMRALREDAPELVRRRMQLAQSTRGVDASSDCQKSSKHIWMDLRSGHEETDGSAPASSTGPQG